MPCSQPAVLGWEERDGGGGEARPGGRTHPGVVVSIVPAVLLIHHFHLAAAVISLLKPLASGTADFQGIYLYYTL